MKNSQMGGDSMWGHSAQFWQSVSDWLLLATVIFGGLAIIASFASTVISGQALKRTQTAADQQIASATARGEEAKAEASRANERAAELALEAEQLKTQIAWRSVTPEQHDALVAALQGHEFEVWVGTLRNDPEAVFFSLGIVKTLRDAGLKIHAHKGMVRAIGLSITQSPVLERDILKDAFASAGLPLRDEAGVKTRRPHIQIIVGSKPPTF